MSASEESHQNLSIYNQFLFIKIFEVNKKQIFLAKKSEIEFNIFMIMLTRSLQMIFNPMRYADNTFPKYLNTMS